MNFISPEPQLPGTGSFWFYHLPRKTFTSWAWGRPLFPAFQEFFASCQIPAPDASPYTSNKRGKTWGVGVQPIQKQPCLASTSLVPSVQSKENRSTRDGVGVGLDNSCAATDQHHQQEDVAPSC